MAKNEFPVISSAVTSFSVGTSHKWTLESPSLATAKHLPVLSMARAHIPTSAKSVTFLLWPVAKSIRHTSWEEANKLLPSAEKASPCTHTECRSDSPKSLPFLKSHHFAWLEPQPPEARVLPSGLIANTWIPSPWSRESRHSLPLDTSQNLILESRPAETNTFASGLSANPDTLSVCATK